MGVFKNIYLLVHNLHLHFGPAQLPYPIPLWKTIFHSTGCLLKFDCIEKQTFFVILFLNFRFGFLL